MVIKPFCKAFYALLRAGGKTIVFEMKKRDGKVHVCIGNNTTADSLLSIINEKIVPDSIVYSDSYASYSKLKASRFKHERINHSKNFAKRKKHINEIENFWNKLLLQLLLKGIYAKTMFLNLTKFQTKVII
ncbi:MAG: transposase [Treponemataceae bacterium]